jgi:hypothetical protein
MRCMPLGTRACCHEARLRHRCDRNIRQATQFGKDRLAKRGSYENLGLSFLGSQDSVNKSRIDHTLITTGEPMIPDAASSLPGPTVAPVQEYLGLRAGDLAEMSS